MTATSSGAHKAITCTCTTIKTSVSCPESLVRRPVSCVLRPASLILACPSPPAVMLLPLAWPLLLCNISFCDFFPWARILLLSFPSIFFFFSAAVRLLAIFHMQHATDVFMFSVCAAHKKVNERHPRRRRFMVTVFIFISVSTSVFETGKLVNCWNCSCSWRSGRDDNGSGQGNGSQLSN